MSRFQVVADADLPADIDRNGMKAGAFYVVCTPPYQGRSWIEWHGVDTREDAEVLRQLLERSDAEAVTAAAELERSTAALMATA